MGADNSIPTETVMQYRELGKSGITVSVLGLGTVKLGRNTAVKYPRGFALPTDAEARRLLSRAQALGVNFIDTAPAYGTSEERLGELLKGKRSDWIIMTKVGEEFSAGQSHYDFSPEHTITSVHRSLERLATDYLDIVLIHSDGDDEHILGHLGTLECLFDLKGQGLVRAVGISHKSANGARLALGAGADVIMATLNSSMRDELDVIAEAGIQGCGVVIKKALESGHAKPESLRFVTEQPGVSSVVVGTLNPEHLAENASMLKP